MKKTLYLDFTFIYRRDAYYLFYNNYPSSLLFKSSVAEWGGLGEWCTSLLDIDCFIYISALSLASKPQLQLIIFF